MFYSLKNKNMSTGKVILGIVAGATAGAIAGILFAPDKGTETRRKISAKGEELVDSAKEKVSGILHNISGKTGGIKEDGNRSIPVQDAKA
jgi:gas vesicle protein